MEQEQPPFSFREAKTVLLQSNREAWKLHMGITSNAKTPFIAWIDENPQQSTGYEQDIASSEATITG